MSISTLRFFNYSYFSLFAIFLSFLPVYLSAKGIPKTDIGMILGAGGVIGIFSQPFWGIVCDRKKTIKKVLMAIIGISIGLGVLLFQSYATLPLVVLVGLMYFFFMPSDPLIESLNYQSAQRYRVHYGSIRMYGAMGYATASIIIGTVTNHFGITSMAYLFLGYGIITFMTCITLDDVQANQKPLRFHDLKRFLSQKNDTCLLFYGFDYRHTASNQRYVYWHLHRKKRRKSAIRRVCLVYHDGH
jgi:PPP family 3-phenylpropionic acid transporter